jgi:hypothetical protein
MDSQQPSFRVYISSDGFRYYIGCQSNNDPNYLGSFSDKSFKPVYKFIVGYFYTREDAGDFEKFLIKKLNTIKDPMFVNKAIVPVKSIEECRKYSLEAYENNPLLKEELSQISKGLWQQSDYVHKQKKAKERLSEKMKEHWKNSEFRAEQSKKISESLRSSKVRNSEEYKQRMKKTNKKGGEKSKEFFKKLKQDPEAYKIFMEERGRKISEAKQRKKAQRLGESRRGEATSKSETDATNI